MFGFQGRLDVNPDLLLRVDAFQSLPLSLMSKFGFKIDEMMIVEGKKSLSELTILICIDV